MALMLTLNGVWTTERELAELIKRDGHAIMIAKPPRITRYASGMRTLLALTLAGIGAGFALPHTDPSQEPSLHFEVLIDGTIHRLGEGKKTAIKIGDTEHQMTVAVSPFRHFAASGVQFDYPREAIFEYELDDEGGTQSWTITFNDMTFMVHRFELGGAKMMARVMLDATVEALDVDAKSKARTLDFGGKSYQGGGAVISMGDSDLDVTMVGLKADGKAVVITIENMLTDDGKVAPDSAAALATIQKTFQLTDK
jgi:hypothetical protein